MAFPRTLPRTTRSIHLVVPMSLLPRMAAKPCPTLMPIGGNGLLVQLSCAVCGCGIREGLGVVAMADGLGLLSRWLKRWRR